MAALVSQAGRLPEVRPERLEYNRLVLDFERINRAIMRARAGGGGSAAELAAQREQVRDAMRRISIDGETERGRGAPAVSRSVHVE